MDKVEEDMFSLNSKIINEIINSTLPSFQLVNLESENLGYGYIFYGITRTMRPKNVVVIGSKAGFAPILFGMAIKDNEGYGLGKIECYNTKLISNKIGKVYFVDPSYSIHRADNNHFYGVGTWDNDEKTKEIWKKYGISGYIEHYRMTSMDFYESMFCPSDIDILYVDGNHSFEGVYYDLSTFGANMKKDSLIIAHDIHPELNSYFPETGGYEAFDSLSDELFEKMRLPFFPGLAIIRRK